jgi:hypothetical protein
LRKNPLRSFNRLLEVGSSTFSGKLKQRYDITFSRSSGEEGKEPKEIKGMKDLFASDSKFPMSSRAVDVAYCFSFCEDQHHCFGALDDKKNWGFYPCSLLNKVDNSYCAKE